MRNGTVPSVIAVLLLAGCADSAPPNEGNDPVSVITDPRDLLNGTAPGSHIHDYWGGRESVKVLESSDGPNSASTDCAEGMRFNTERPAEGAIVPQGTAWVNGTFTLESDGRDQYGAIELWVKTAQDSEPWLWGEIRSGEQFSIPSSQERNDPPHYVLSLWEFELHTIGATDMHIGGTYHWNIDAVRGLPLCLTRRTPTGGAMQPSWISSRRRARRTSPTRSTFQRMARKSSALAVAPGSTA